MASGTGVRDFTDYGNQPWPGKTLPITFNNVADAGDGFPGVQWAMRTWTKDYLHSGGMETGLLMDGQDITGVANFYIAGKSEIAGDITGFLDYISGFEMISANTGQFAHLTGFSPIQLGTNLDFQGTYHLQDVSEITGAIISGLQITGTSGVYGDTITTTANITTIITSEITGTSGIMDDVILTKAPDTVNHVPRLEDIFWSTGTDILLHSNTTVRSWTGAAAKNVKQINIGAHLHNCTITWEFDAPVPLWTSYTRLYLNDSIAIGDTEELTTSNFVTITRVITGNLIKPGDFVNINAWLINPGGTMDVKNFNIYHSIGESNDP